MVGEHGDAGIARDVVQPPQLPGRFGFGVHSTVDVVALDRERNRDDMRLTIWASCGQPGDRDGGESLPCLVR